MNVNGYVLVNPEKVERAINGTVMSQGQLKGGVGEDADSKELLAEYDRLGGLILKDGKYKVKTGSFYDIKGKKPFAKPDPVLLFNVNGETVEIKASEPLPLEVQAAVQADEKKKGKAKAKAKKATDAKQKKSAAKKKKAEDSEETEGEADDDSEEEEDGELA